MSKLKKLKAINVNENISFKRIYRSSFNILGEVQTQIDNRNFDYDYNLYINYLCQNIEYMASVWKSDRDKYDKLKAKSKKLVGIVALLWSLINKKKRAEINLKIEYEVMSGVRRGVQIGIRAEKNAEARLRKAINKQRK